MKVKQIFQEISVRLEPCKEAWFGRLTVESSDENSLTIRSARGFDLPMSALDGPEPFRAWVLTVESQHRIRLPKQILETCKWLETAEEPNNVVVGTISHLGGLRFSPESARDATVRKELAARLEQSPARSEEAAAAWMDLVRFMATAWPVTIQVERKSERISISLPAEARKLGIVPSAGETAVVFASGEIIEVHKAVDWLKHSQAVGGRLQDLLDESAAAFDSRSQ